MIKKKVSKKKIDAIVRSGGSVKITSAPRAASSQPQPAPTPTPPPKPISEGSLFSKKEIKEIMIEAMKIATRNERRGTSRLIVKRDSRGFIDTVDIVPVEEPVTLQ
jgi:hypothetical protein